MVLFCCLVWCFMCEKFQNMFRRHLILPENFFGPFRIFPRAKFKFWMLWNFFSWAPNIFFGFIISQSISRSFTSFFWILEIFLRDLKWFQLFLELFLNWESISGISEIIKIPHFFHRLKTWTYIHVDNPLDATLTKVQPIFVTAVPSLADLKPKFEKGWFSANSLVSFSGQTIASRHQLPPPWVSPHRSIHHSVLLFSNLSQFDHFPFVFLFPVGFPRSSFHGWAWARWS
jgi:hypothetical protein